MYEGLLVLSVVVFAVAVVIYMRHPAASMFHPATFYLAYHGVVFVVRPIFAWYYDFNEMYLAVGFAPSLWDKARVLICTNLGLVTFLAVVLWVAREPIRFRPDAINPVERTRLLITFLPIAAPMALLGIYSLWWMINYRATGQSLGYIDPLTGSTSLQASNGYFISAGSVLGALSAMIAHLGRYRLLSLLPFAVFAVLSLATGIRGTFVTVSVMIGLMFLFSRRLKWPSAKLLLILLLVIPVFVIVRADRGASIREAFGVDIRYDVYANLETTKSKPLETMDLANMEFFEFLVGVVPEKTGTYDYFVQNLQLLIAPIPRAIWKEKPIGAPIQMFQLYKYGKSLGGTYSLPGMGWYYMGYLGVVIWCGLFALIYATAHRMLAYSRQSNLAMMAYCMLIPTSIIVFRDGTLMSLASQILFFFVPIVALALLARFNLFAEQRGLGVAAAGNEGAAPSAAQFMNALTPRERRLAASSSEAIPPAAPVGEVKTETETPRQRRLARMGGA